VSGHVSTQADQRATDEHHDLDTSGGLARRRFAESAGKRIRTQDVFVDKTKACITVMDSSVDRGTRRMQRPIRAPLLWTAR
jgi:hypothetical protein